MHQQINQFVLKILNLFSSLNPKKLWDSASVRDFAKAVSMVLAMVLPIVFGVYSGSLDMGIFITLGVVFASFSDTSGSIRLKVKGMFLAVLLSLLVTFIMHVLLHHLETPFWTLLPILGLLIFGVSYLSVYGFRASLISFSGLFAIVLSMSRISDSDISLYARLLLIGSGGLWYIVMVLSRQALFPKSSTEYFLSETLNLTADYLEIRAKLIDDKNDRKELIKELLDTQNQLTENHETLREILLSRRLGSGKSFYQARRLLVFRQTVDMLELAMANPVNYMKTDKIFENNPGKMEDFQEVMYAMGTRLRYLAKYLSEPAKIKHDIRISLAVDQLKFDIHELIANKETANHSDILALKNYWKYQYNQFLKIKNIENLIINRNELDVERVKKEDRSKFLTKQEYNLETLIDNFNIQSSIFRHSLRIAVVGIVGYSLGVYLNLVNPYWILLTIIIIMRPNYGLTKERFKDRSIGTIIGGALAFGIIVLIQNTTIYAILAISCYTIGLSMIQRNYKAAAAFITMYVVFVYALLNPEVFMVIQYRIIDTLIGAGLAFLGSWILWPFWEIKSIDKTLQNSIKANREYLSQIAMHYNQKGEVTQDYKLSRKAAFLALSDLNSSFQRMAQEPRAQHKSLDEVFQIVMLMHSFLASLASLGTYIIHNKTTPASEDFNRTVEAIQGNLSLCEEALEKVSILRTEEELTTHTFDEKYEKELKKIALQEEANDDWEHSTVEEEAHLLFEQFKWLMANSHRMAKILKSIDFE